MFALGLAAAVMVLFAAGLIRDTRSFANVVFLGLGLALGALGSAELLAPVKLGLLATIGVLLAGYVSFLFVSYVSYGFVFGRMTTFADADFVVVLGSGLAGGRRVPPLLASRLERGSEVYAALAARGTPGPVLIVSGGKGGDERIPEAEAMAAYLIARGFPAGRLMREDRSRSTEENIAFSKAIMDQSRPGARCVIVTSSFHAYRAAIIARRAGVDGQVTGAPTAGCYWPAAMAREFAAACAGYKLVNAAICALIMIVPVAYAAVHGS